MNAMTRSYELKERGKRQQETRQKIIEAAIHLHQTRGIAATSMNDIAEQADVGKVTVYRHFPDMAAMVGACSGQYFERNPFPDPELWRAAEDPVERMRHGLNEAYDWYASTEAMMSRVYPEARDHPVMAPYHAHWAHAADVLLEVWPEKGRRKVLLRAAIALALDFDTWRTLVKVQGLSNTQATELMARLTCDCPPANQSTGTRSG